MLSCIGFSVDLWSNVYNNSGAGYETEKLATCNCKVDYALHLFFIRQVLGGARRMFVPSLVLFLLKMLFNQGVEASINDPILKPRKAEALN